MEPRNVQEQQSDLEELRRKIEIRINELEQYRNQCLTIGLGYYDAFKNKTRRDLDFQANLGRLDLAALWEKIELLGINVSQSEDWRRLATHYRLLVEPLDIANFYRLGKDEDTGGPYLSHGRPRRFKTFQQWLEDNEGGINNQLRAPAISADEPAASMLTQDSCLWAYVEEMAYLMRTDHVTESAVAEFEERVRRLFDSNGLCMEELLAGESTFKMVVKGLWVRKTPEQQASAPLSSIIAKYPELTE